MKKRIALSLVSLILIACAFIIPVFAKDTNALHISESYKTVTYKGEAYDLCDATYLNLNPSSDYIYNIELTAAQQNEIESVNAYDYGAFIMLDLYFSRGGGSTLYYLNRDYADALCDFIQDGGSQYEIMTEGYLYNSFSISASRHELYGTPLYMQGYEIMQHKYHATVLNYSDDMSFEKVLGNIITDGDGNFYFVDYYQFGAENAEYFDPIYYGTVRVYKITDKDLLSTFMGDDDLSSDYEDEYTSIPLAIISGAILTILLGIAPLVGAILCLIFSYKAKRPYRQLLRATAIALGCAVIAFIIIAIMLFSAMA